MPSMRIARLLLVCSLILSACAEKNVVSPAPDIDQSAQLRAAVEHYSQLVLAGDSKGLAALFTPDGEISHAGKTIVQGSAAIATLLASTEGKYKVESNVDKVDSVSVEGGVATVTGSYQQTVLVIASHEEASVQGKFRSIWVRQPDGQWLIRSMSTFS